MAEARDPSQPTWIYDALGHSEDYNHSTFNDLVISGLIGLRPGARDTLAVKPLVPGSWDYFVLENTPYHGHNVTVLYDRIGARYGQGPGLHVYVDGRQVASTGVTIRPGDRFALQLAGNTITSWVQPGGSGSWQHLVSTTLAPVLDSRIPASARNTTSPLACAVILAP